MATKDRLRSPLLTPRAECVPPKGFRPARYSRDLTTFSRVYRRAAQRLAGENDSGSIDALPVVFLYRHAIETAIKAVLVEAGISSTTVSKRSHDLAKQMPDLKQVADGLQHPISSHLEGMIGRWAASDPNGMNARCPTDKKGKPMLIANDEQFHLQPFADDAEQVLDELYDLLGDMQSAD